MKIKEARELFDDIVLDISGNLSEIVKNETERRKILDSIIKKTDKIWYEYLEEKEFLHLKAKKYIYSNRKVLSIILLCIIAKEDIHTWKIFDDEEKFNDIIKRKFFKIYCLLCGETDYCYIQLEDFLSVIVKEKYLDCI